MNKGVEFFLKSLGVSITSEELEAAFEHGKNSLPKIAQAFDEMNGRMLRMELNQLAIINKLELLLSRTSGEVTPDPVHEDVLGSASAADLQNAFVNGAPELVVRNG